MDTTDISDLQGLSPPTLPQASEHFSIMAPISPFRPVIAASITKFLYSIFIKSVCSKAIARSMREGLLRMRGVSTHRHRQALIRAMCGIVGVTCTPCVGAVTIR